MQGSCCWVDGSGRCVRLTDTSLLTLSEVERRALQQAALARLQQLNLGTTIKIPEGKISIIVVYFRVFTLAIYQDIIKLTMVRTNNTYLSRTKQL